MAHPVTNALSPQAQAGAVVPGGFCIAVLEVAVVVYRRARGLNFSDQNTLGLLLI